MGKILHISPEEILIESEKIFKPIKYGENGIGICYPCCKIQYNLSCFLENKSILKKNLGKQYDKFLFIPINLEQQDNERAFVDKIIDYLRLKKINAPKNKTLPAICRRVFDQGKDPYFFLLDAHILKVSELNKILRVVHSQILQSGRVGAMVFFEKNIDEQNLSKIFKERNKFLQNIIYFPVYANNESEKFLKNLAASWKLKISRKIIKNIVLNIGGSLWLLRESLRQYRENPNISIKHILNSQSIQLRLQKMFALFSQEEKNVLISICLLNKKNVDLTIVQHLMSIGILVKRDSNFTISIPPLLPYLQTENMANQFSTSKDNKILFNNINVSDVFTNQEFEVLQLLINNKEIVIPREKIAEAMWKTEWEERYSEWAIDKLISRLRSKISSISHHKSIIQTIKTKGVIFS